MWYYVAYLCFHHPKRSGDQHLRRQLHLLMCLSIYNKQVILASWSLSVTVGAATRNTVSLSATVLVAKFP